MSLDLMSKIVLDDFLRYIVGNAKNVSSGHAFIGSCKKTTFFKRHCRPRRCRRQRRCYLKYAWRISKPYSFFAAAASVTTKASLDPKRWSEPTHELTSQHSWEGTRKDIEKERRLMGNKCGKNSFVETWQVPKSKLVAMKRWIKKVTDEKVQKWKPVCLFECLCMCACASVCVHVCECVHACGREREEGERGKMSENLIGRKERQSLAKILHSIEWRAHFLKRARLKNVYICSYLHICRIFLFAFEQETRKLGKTFVQSLFWLPLKRNDVASNAPTSHLDIWDIVEAVTPRSSSRAQANSSD